MRTCMSQTYVRMHTAHTNSRLGTKGKLQEEYKLRFVKASGLEQPRCKSSVNGAQSGRNWELFGAVGAGFELQHRLKSLLSLPFILHCLQTRPEAGATGSFTGQKSCEISLQSATAELRVLKGVVDSRWHHVWSLAEVTDHSADLQGQICCV